MILISHRGNIKGIEQSQENNPLHIMRALDRGFNVEIDVWYIDSKLYLGHDEPKFLITEHFLRSDKLWCHAKNLEALNFLLKKGVHCFWHQGDDCSVTSKGFVWMHQKCRLIVENSIIHSDNLSVNPKAIGVYSDNVLKL
jgi:hypothetical protein